MNRSCYESTQNSLEHLERNALRVRGLSWINNDPYLFSGRLLDRPLSMPTLNDLVEDWCRKVISRGNYGSHTPRKTCGYLQRTKQDTPIPFLTQAIGHASKQQTLSYICIQDEEIELKDTSLKF